MQLACMQRVKALPPKRRDEPYLSVRGFTAKTVVLLDVRKAAEQPVELVVRETIGTPFWGS